MEPKAFKRERLKKDIVRSNEFTMSFCFGNKRALPYLSFLTLKRSVRNAFALKGISG